MLAELKFTSARSSLSDLFDQVWHQFLPAVVKRHQTEEVLLVRRDLQKDILRAYTFKPEVLQEEDGSVTLALDEIELVVNAPTFEEAARKLVQEMKIYAEDYKERIHLFLHAPNRRGHFPYVLRIWLCESDEEIRSFLEV